MAPESSGRHSFSHDVRPLASAKEAVDAVQEPPEKVFALATALLAGGLGVAAFGSAPHQDETRPHRASTPVIVPHHRY